MQQKRLIWALCAAIAVIALVPVATALGDDDELEGTIQAVVLGNSFTYQGRLTDGGSPANGTYDLRFILYDAESGGSQVGGTVNREDVNVANGLFTVDLEFGATAFNGEARWMEIAVRPGASAASHTVLSPRQGVSPAPYALYAKAAGGFAVPLTAAGNSDGAPASTTGLFTVTQSGTGIAIAGNRTSTDAAAYPAVLGTNAGGGAGVQGESTNAAGTGVQGFATGTNGIGGYFSGATGAKVVSSTVAGTALDVDGPIRVSGTNPTAFVHVATSGNTTVAQCGDDQCTEINNPLINGNESAILIVTQHFQNSTEVYNEASIGVWYNPVAGRWNIFNQDKSPMPVGAAFNVLVILR
jgi:hypothetical protein